MHIPNADMRKNSGIERERHALIESAQLRAIMLKTTLLPLAAFRLPPETVCFSLPNLRT